VKLQRLGMIAGVGLTAALAISACSDPKTTPSSAPESAKPKVECATGALSAAGSSAQKNAMLEWIKNYAATCTGGKVEYNANGSGAGIQAFTAKTADFAGSDSALKDTEQPPADTRCGAGAKAIHLPMVTGPVAISFNLTGIKDLQLKPATIAKIFAGTITKWDDPAIKADNASATLPSLPIQAVHRSDSSGTTDNFTAYLAATATSDWSFAHDKVWKAPGGAGAAGSDGVAKSISSTVGTIGYVELSFAQNSSLNMAKIANGNGEFVALTAESAGKTVASATQVTPDDLKLKIDYNTKAAGAYPLVLVTYEIVCGTGNADKAALLKSFLTYTASAPGQSQLTALGYAPLPESVRAKVEAAAQKIA